MKRYGQAHEIVTDKLGSYSAAMKVIGNAGLSTDAKFTEILIGSCVSLQPFQPGALSLQSAKF